MFILYFRALAISTLVVKTKNFKEELGRTLVSAIAAAAESAGCALINLPCLKEEEIIFYKSLGAQDLVEMEDFRWFRLTKNAMNDMKKKFVQS